MDSILRGPGELIAFLPYQLGFTPVDSLVVVGLSDGGIEVVARLDLGPGHEMAPGIDRIAKAFEQAWVQDTMVLVFVDSAAAVQRSGSPITLFDQVAARLSMRGVGTSHALLVTENLWWAHACGCGLCPPWPTEVPRPDRIGAVFQAVVRGVAPLPCREELARSLQCAHPRLARDIDRSLAIARPMPRGRLVKALGLILLGEGDIHEMGALELASIGRAMRKTSVRDEVFRWVTPDAPEPEPVESVGPAKAIRTPLLPVRDEAGHGACHDGLAVRARLVQWLHCLPDSLRPAVLTLIAGSAWGDGSGAMAGVAVDEALRIDPEYRLAELVGCAVERGTRPRRRV